MRPLETIFHSVVESYNNKESINFVDLRDLDGLINRELFESFVKSYNNKESINFIQVRELEKLT